MSPFVWRQHGRYMMALRIVEPVEGTCNGVSSVCFAEGDGQTFELADFPALDPGPGEEDIEGCEDPTMFFHEGLCKVYYTGYCGNLDRSKLLFASGPDIAHLTKHGDVLHATHHWNTKEATIVQTPQAWRLFYEYSEGVHSLIGVASSKEPDGHWHHQTDPFHLREDHWDSWHLSTGPIVFKDSKAPVMFYNGANQDAHWRIGWIEFDKDCTEVVARCDEALVRPEHLPSGFPDIAFAASALEHEDGYVELYFSISDRKLAKAIIEVCRD